MRNLPSTMTEVERAALEFARQELGSYRNGDSPWSKDSPLSPAGSHAMVQSFLQLGWGDLDDARLRLVMLARLGVSDAAAVLDRIILECQSSARRAARSQLCGMGHGAEDLRHAGTGGRKPKKSARMLRDICITMTTMAVIDRFGLPRTKRSPTRRSACEIVALALESVGIFMGYKAVEKIVERYRGAWGQKAGSYQFSWDPLGFENGIDGVPGNSLPGPSSVRRPPTPARVSGQFHFRATTRERFDGAPWYPESTALTRGPKDGRGFIQRSPPSPPPPSPPPLRSA